MTTTQAVRCFNCERGDGEVPLLDWRYQGQALWICPDCLPALIHKRGEILPLWTARQPQPADKVKP